jgi:hypothetical protein
MERAYISEGTEIDKVMGHCALFVYIIFVIFITHVLFLILDIRYIVDWSRAKTHDYHRSLELSQ